MIYGCVHKFLNLCICDIVPGIGPVHCPQGSHTPSSYGRELLLQVVGLDDVACMLQMALIDA